jgi:hypothetical protein
VPIVFNEPVSFLQRIAEYMEYAELIKIASQQTDAVQRIEVSLTRLFNQIYIILFGF